MYHFIFIKEASLETEYTHSAQQNNTSDIEESLAEQQDQSNKNNDVLLNRKLNQPNDIRDFISKN